MVGGGWDSHHEVHDEVPLHEHVTAGEAGAAQQRVLVGCHKTRAGQEEDEWLLGVAADWR